MEAEALWKTHVTMLSRERQTQSRPSRITKCDIVDFTSSSYCSRHFNGFIAISVCRSLLMGTAAGIPATLVTRSSRNFERLKEKRCMSSLGFALRCSVRNPQIIGCNRKGLTGCYGLDSTGDRA